MGGKDAVRKRHRNSSSPRKKQKIDKSLDTDQGYCGQFCFAIGLTSLVLVICLSIAYYKSPISAVIVDDIHDVRLLEWAKLDNNYLQRGKKILLDLPGPESIVADDDGNWYTGLLDGRLVKITDAGKEDQSVTEIAANFAKGSMRKHKRPLGIRRHRHSLYFIDGFQGVFTVDLKTNESAKIVGYDDVNPHMMFPDDLAISMDGKTIYFTDVSEKWGYNGVAFSIIEGECSGRIFKVDVETKHTDLIYHRLCFPNGIELDSSETKLLVSENARRRISVIDLNSRHIVKTIKLPGGSDNIRKSRDGGYWVAVPALADPVIDFIWKLPALRTILASILGERGLLKLAKLNQGIVVKLGKDFEPNNIYYDLDGKVSQAITEAFELESGKLLLGSFISSGIVELYEKLP